MVARRLRDRGGLRRAGLPTLTLALGATTLTACQIGQAATQSGTAQNGGTLQVVVAAMPTHLDPHRVATATEANLSRLITRTLTTYRATSGSEDTEVVGDLATDAGRPSEGFRVWEFTLKPGLKWADGTPLTCDDVKYGIQRSFRGAAFPVPAPYPRLFLQDNAEPYGGPLIGDNNAGKGLESIVCSAVDSLRIQLRHPTPDFGRALASPVFAPVPKDQDNGERYDAKPFSSGPYRIERVESNGIRYIRNPYWSRNTDPVRRAYPDRIVVTVSSDAETMTNRIIGSEDAWANAVLLDQDVAPNLLEQVVNDTSRSAQVLTGTSEGTRFLAVNTRRLPVFECRQAINYAVDRKAYRDSIGGPYAGEYATGVISPRLKAHRDFDLIGVAAAAQGNPQAAAALLKQAGNCPKSVTVAFPDRRDVRASITTMVEPLKNAGIRLELRPLDPDRYLDLIGIAPGSAASGGTGNAGYDLLYVEWMPEWPSGAAIIPPLFDGRLIPRPGTGGNQNLSLLNDSWIHGGIDVALNEPEPARQHALWGELDERIQSMTATIPLLYPKAVRIVGSNVRGGYLHPRFGQLDVCSLGLADPTVRPDGLGAAGRQLS